MFWSKSYLFGPGSWITGLLVGHESLLTGIVTEMAGADAASSLHGNSGGFARSQYGMWEDAKLGLVSRRGFAKLHPLTSVRGTIVGFAVTDGTVHDSPTLRRIYEGLPCGTGS